MYFLQAARAPVPLTVGETVFSVPKFTMENVVTWSNEIMDENTERLTTDMDAPKKREYLTFYPPIPPDLTEMKRRIRTPEGILKVFRDCMERATVTKGPPPEDLKKFAMNLIRENGGGPLAAFVWILADLDESSAVIASGKRPDSNSEESGADPLTKSAGQGSPGSPVIGTRTSPSSTRPLAMTVGEK